MKKIILIYFLLITLIASFISAQELYGNETNKTEETIDPSLVRLLARTITAGELDIPEVRETNLEVETIGTSVELAHETTADLVKDNIKELDKQVGYEKLIEAMKGLNSNTKKAITTTRKLDVYEVKPVYANSKLKTYRTIVKLSISADQDYDNLQLIQIIPKKVTNNYSKLFFTENSPIVINTDPIALLWNFKNSKQGEEFEVGYIMKSLVVGDEGDVIIATGSGDIIAGENSIVAGSSNSDNKFSNSLDRELKRFGTLFSDSLIVVSVVGFLLFILMILLAELHGKDTFCVLRNIKRDIIASIILGASNKVQLENYIRECINKGVKPEKIRVSLVKAGWDKKAVRLILKKYI